ncbi:hypothetical protein N657DRAFT_702570 [Parathielavia appendiculata]|uniref:Heterokaryon incompatibility domain-containing protein n=1 Tax=Parathielavia appendiculata TaxID=2587402 RepID=A0AAN6TSX3_9PEZI|nr:hypothetical protein N657DRAFT_702570 [Parathielavia appendiculata]
MGIRFRRGYPPRYDGRHREEQGWSRQDSFLRRSSAPSWSFYFWIDTCCIDKTNGAELNEAINSMFWWYRNAARCYVYLSDIFVVDNQPQPNDQLSNARPSWESTFRESRWFTRGWTLQELLAPASVLFFAKDGSLHGDKASLPQELHEITGISISALYAEPLAHFSAEQRFKWAEKRKTKREKKLGVLASGHLRRLHPDHLW